MNRSIAVFVALVTLLAHILAIHNDGQGAFAFPYDQAYVPFRLARNLVFDGQLAWNPGAPAFESYHSVLWVLVCAAGERIAPHLHVSMNSFVQTIGIVCMLLVVFLASRVRTDRIATMLAPLFLATSGAVAAAAANGLETGLFTLTALVAFLALESGRSWWFAVSLTACCLTRPEGVVFLLALFVLRVVGKANDDEGERPRVSPFAFAMPLLVLGAVTLARWQTTGFLLPPALWAAFHPADDAWRTGVLDLRDFLLSSITPLLLAFPAWYLLRGSLSRTGSHAAFVALAWTVAVGWRGRSTLPFAESMVPALPFVFLAAQEGLIVALDGVSRLKRRITVVAIVGCLAGCVLASKTPGDLGPIPFGNLHERWMTSSGSGRFDYASPLGRRGLQEEIETTIRFRRVALFLRDQIEVGSTILTPWPGAIGYLSRQPVHDLLGRADPLHPLDRPRTWTRRERADVVAALRADDDYVVPFAGVARSTMTRGALAAAWHEGLDERPGDPTRRAAIEGELERYELITVPIHDFVARGQPRATEPFQLLRAKRLDLRPRVELRQEGQRYRVMLFHRSHPQLADLHVNLLTSDGRSFSLRPTGVPCEDSSVHARTNVLLYDTGARGVELVRGKLPPPPDGTTWSELRAVLRNPDSRGDDPYAFVSDELRVPL